MTRIKAKFEELRREGRGAIIPFLMAGDPDPASSVRLALDAVAGGADILELGLPFSDPVADGPVIQRAAARALASGTNVSRVIETARRVREKSGVPLVLMTYYNPVFRHGGERFLRAATAAGVDGLILVDLPPEEGGAFFRAARASGLDTIMLAAPTTPPGREEALARLSTGFLYCVSRAGTTGARGDVPAGLEERIKRLKALGPLPVAVGFGVSRPEQARRILAFADGVVVGSALVAAVEAGEAPGNWLRRLREGLTRKGPGV